LNYNIPQRYWFLKHFLLNQFSLGEQKRHPSKHQKNQTFEQGKFLVFKV